MSDEQCAKKKNNTLTVYVFHFQATDSAALQLQEGEEKKKTQKKRIGRPTRLSRSNKWIFYFSFYA